MKINKDGKRGWNAKRISRDIENIISKFEELKNNMKKIKVSIKDENTLILSEDGSKGDIIDLKSIHETDIDKTTIASVVNSIKINKFNDELKKETDRIEHENKLKLELKEKEYADRAKESLSEKEKEIIALNSKLENIAEKTESDVKLKTHQEKQELEEKYREKLNEKNTEISTLKSEKDKEIIEISSKLENIAEKTESDVKLKYIQEKQEVEKEYQEKLSKKESEISDIKHEKELGEEKLKEQLKSSETALVSLKEMRAKMSTKMIGESLEIHCENEFNKIRSIAFPNSQFGKDNAVSKSGSKGDYIYREMDNDGNEILSIMFEMKNEDDGTATKKKNKDFFKKLDNDREEKKCEYAVLVSLLEKDNEYYDDIVTVHEYKLMYTIRPQHFITVIGFLRQANTKSQHLRREIHMLKNENIDVSNFEVNMNNFKEAFSKNYNSASKQFNEAIKGIDKTIDNLNKVKDNLLKSDNNLRLANNKATDLSIKKLTKNSPSVAKAFEEVNK